MRGFKLTLGIVLLTAMLALSAFYLRSTKQLNGFTRVFHYVKLKTLNTVALRNRVLEISGTSATEIYLAVLPNKICRIHWQDTVTGIDSLRFGMQQEIINSFHIEIDSPYATVFAGNIPQIIRLRIDNGNIMTIVRPDRKFTLGTMLPDGTFILKSFVKELRDFIFCRVDSTGHTEDWGRVLSETIPDYGFSMQGGLVNDQGRLICFHRLFNLFYCFDEQLILKYSARTIDTNDKATIRSRGYVNFSRNVKTSRESPQYVNRAACVSGEHIYFLSAIRADNEKSADIEAYEVIDVYRLSNGKYRYSFYVPKVNRQEISCFKVDGGRLIAIYNKARKAVIYKLEE